MIRLTAEDALGNILREGSQIASHPLILKAADVLAGVLSQVYMLLFPKWLVVSGPFVQAPVIRDRLAKLVAADLPRYAPRDFGINVATHSARDKIVGAAQPLLRKAFLARLDSSRESRRLPRETTGRVR